MEGAVRPDESLRSDGSQLNSGPRSEVSGVAHRGKLTTNDQADTSYFFSEAPEIYMHLYIRGCTEDSSHKIFFF